jgi:uracil-DNA glycosylase
VVSCGIALVGEAPGREEDATGHPFVGEAGKELTRMCQRAGVARQECLVTNVFMDRPPENRLDAWCVPKKELSKFYPMPALAPGKYIVPEKLPELDRLRAELEAFKPTVIVPLGATALWAVCHYTQIGKYRGAVQLAKILPGVKVVPTWHPANILRNWSNRVVSIIDLMKAKREAAYPEIRVTRREVWIEPTLRDLYEFKERYITGAEVQSVDIETARYDFITCVGIAPSADRCLVVPFVDRRKPGYCYWATLEEEVEAWRFIFQIMAEYEVLGQNFLYDLWYLREMGLPLAKYRHDTMLKHHAFEPEMAKDLGFMGSIYANETVWKQERPKRRKATTKRED